MARRIPKRATATPPLGDVVSLQDVLRWLARLHASWEPRISYQKLTDAVNARLRADPVARLRDVGKVTVYELIAPVNGRRVQVNWDLVLCVAAELGAEPPVLERLRTIVDAIDDRTAPPVPVEIREPVPHPDCGFTGRAAELSRIGDLLKSAHERRVAPMVMIDGPAGMGKSALAIEAAHRLLRGPYRGARSLYVDLYGFQEESDTPAWTAVMAGLSVRLGVPPERAGDLTVAPEMKRNWYRSAIAQRPTVLVLDNATEIDHIRPILPGTQSCTIIATSRLRCDEPGLDSVTLGALNQDDAVNLLRRTDPRRVDADPVTARRLAVTSCFGHPYHLNVLTGLLNDPEKQSWSLIDIAVFVDKQDPDEASRRLLAASVSGLAPTTLWLFRLLSLLAGYGFTPVDAAVLADVSRDEAARSLSQLHRLHLIHRIDPHRDRYAMHAITAAFARRQRDDAISHSEQQEALDRIFDSHTKLI